MLGIAAGLTVLVLFCCASLLTMSIDATNVIAAIQANLGPKWQFAGLNPSIKSKAFNDVSEEYKPGMGLMVAVESLDVDRAKRKIDISLSHALIERSEAKVETVSERMLNARYDATVVASNDKFYFVIIEGMKIRGIVPKDYYYGTGELVRNDSVAFLVTGINKERNMLIGRCIKSN